jgi:branched-chain amino acid transport system ATP-binding protein
LQEIDLEVRAGERVGLIGPNGSGKSTLVNCVAGDFSQHQGSVWLGGRPLGRIAPHKRTALGLARTFQLPRPFRSMSVLANVAMPLLFARNEDASTDRAHECLRQVGLAARADALPRDLTQVDLRRLELARAIAARPRLLLADEVMAGLSHVEVDEILGLLFRLNAEGIAIVMIEHIMRAVTAFAERLIVLVAGRMIADGPTRAVLASPEVESAYLGE